MLLVVAAWVCMAMVFLLAWLWLQGLSPKLSEATPGDNTAHGLVVATALWYTVLSVVLLIVHFAGRRTPGRRNVGHAAQFVIGGKFV